MGNSTHCVDAAALLPDGGTATPARRQTALTKNLLTSSGAAAAVVTRASRSSCSSSALCAASAARADDAASRAAAAAVRATASASVAGATRGKSGVTPGELVELLSGEATGRLLPERSVRGGVRGGGVSDGAAAERGVLGEGIWMRTPPTSSFRLMSITAYALDGALGETDVADNCCPFAAATTMPVACERSKRRSSRRACDSCASETPTRELSCITLLIMPSKASAVARSLLSADDIGFRPNPRT